MEEESDRVAMVSDLVVLENRLVRHFDVMVERVEAAVGIVADVNAHHAVVLDDHGMRLKTIEKAR